MVHTIHKYGLNLLLLFIVQAVATGDHEELLGKMISGLQVNYRYSVVVFHTRDKSIPKIKVGMYQSWWIVNKLHLNNTRFTERTELAYFPGNFTIDEVCEMAVQYSSPSRGVLFPKKYLSRKLK